MSFFVHGCVSIDASLMQLAGAAVWGEAQENRLASGFRRGAQ